MSNKEFLGIDPEKVKKLTRCQKRFIVEASKHGFAWCIDQGDGRPVAYGKPNLTNLFTMEVNETADEVIANSSRYVPA